MSFSHLLKLKLTDIIKYNILKRFAQIRPYRGTSIWTGKNAKIIGNGKLVLNTNQKKINGRKTVIKMDNNSKWYVTGNSHIYYGADITLEKGAVLSMGECVINTNLDIYCSESITIGNNVLIGQHCTIRDTDGHSIVTDDMYNKGKLVKPVIIEDHVWIAINCTILKGVRIGKNSIIAAGSVVTKDIPPNCLAAGVPAKVIKEGVTWKQ